MSYIYIPRVSQRTWRRHGQHHTGICIIVRWTWWRQGQYPKGVCYMADGPRRRQGQYPKGVCCMVKWTGQTQGQYPKGVCYRVDWPDRGRPRISARWSLDLTHLRRNGVVYHLVSDKWSMEPLNVLTSSIEHKTNWFWHEYDVYWGKR